MMRRIEGGSSIASYDGVPSFSVSVFVFLYGFLRGPVSGAAIVILDLALTLGR